MSASIKGLPAGRLRTASRRDLDSEAYEQALTVTPPTAAAIKSVRRHVKRGAHDKVDERELLDALGLLP